MLLTIGGTGSKRTTVGGSASSRIVRPFTVDAAGFNSDRHSPDSGGVTRVGFSGALISAMARRLPDRSPP